MKPKALRAAGRRDRRVYQASHPLLFALLAVSRFRHTLRLGRTVIINDTSAFREALMTLPFDRQAAGTTGGIARELLSPGVLFDQEGQQHRQARRSAASLLSSAGLSELRPVWLQVLAERVKPLSRNETVDVVDLAAAMAGATVAKMFGTTADPLQLAKVAQTVAAAAAREHLPGLRRRKASGEAAAQLSALLSSADSAAPMLAVAAISTTIAGIPRAVAWCADGRLWAHAEEPALVDELLRTVAPSPLLPRVAAGSGMAGREPVRTGDRLLLVARHAVRAHDRDPDIAAPAPAQMSQLVFGVGPHACPGAAMARQQLADVLQALAPYQPAVVKAVADRDSALPGWRSLLIQAKR